MAQAGHTAREAEAAFGQSEHEHRLKDMADFKTGLLTLDEVKARAEQRRRSAGLGRDRADELVRDVSREIRRAEASVAKAGGK